MRRLIIACFLPLGLLACNAQEQPPPAPEPTEVPLSAEEQLLINERIAAIRDAKDFKAAQEAYQMDARYTERMRAAVTPAFIERYRDAVTKADNREELEELRKYAPDLESRMFFNRRWIDTLNAKQN